MKWEKITIETTTEAIDHISNLLVELGIEGIEIEDKIPLSEEDKKKLFIDFLPDLEEDDGTAFVHFYLDGEIKKDKKESILSEIKKGLFELSNFVSIGSGNMVESETEDSEWIDNWKEFFKPFRIDDEIIIKPTWEALEDIKDTDIVIELDPGTAFGTGAHETTKLCVLALKKYLKQGDVVLDIGCGSGILSIAARKLGASKTIGTDIDKIAIDVSYENAAINHLSEETCSFYLCDVISIDTNLPKLMSNDITVSQLIESNEDRMKLNAIVKEYDVVVANILADVIIPLSGIVSGFMKPDGYFISSGIIDSRKEEVKFALIRNGFTIIDTIVLGEWISYIAICNK